MYKDFGEDASLGQFTRDFRQNVDRCRVLITVPQCLEILVLSPTNRAWVRGPDQNPLMSMHQLFVSFALTA